MAEIGSSGWMERLKTLRCRFYAIGLTNNEIDEMRRMEHQLHGFEVGQNREVPPGWKKLSEHTPRDGQRALVAIDDTQHWAMEFDAARDGFVAPGSSAVSMYADDVWWVEIPPLPTTA